MTLSKILGNPPGRTPSVRCTVGGVLSRLSADDRKAFTIALRDKRPAGENFEYAWPSQTLADTMTEAGYPLSGQAIRRHRRQECTCPQA